MKKAKIKIQSYKENISVIDNQIDLRTKFFNIFIFAFIIFFILYSFLLIKMVFNIVERKTVELEIRELNSMVAELESSYSSLINEVDKENYLALGFKEIKPSYSQNRQAISLGYNNNSKLLVNEIQ